MSQSVALISAHAEMQFDLPDFRMRSNDSSPIHSDVFAVCEEVCVLAKGYLSS